MPTATVQPKTDKIALTPQRLNHLKEVALYFQGNPGATNFLGVPKNSCFWLLSAIFSDGQEFLDPASTDFLAKTLEKIRFWEETLPKTAEGPPLLAIPQNLEELLKEWQEFKGQPETARVLPSDFSSQLEKASTVIQEEKTQEIFNESARAAIAKELTTAAKKIEQELSTVAVRADLPPAEKENIVQVFSQNPKLTETLAQQVLTALRENTQLGQFPPPQLKDALSKATLEIFASLNQQSQLKLTPASLQELSNIVATNAFPHFSQVFSLQKLQTLASSPEELRQNYSQIKETVNNNLEAYVGRVLASSQINPTTPQGQQLQKTLSDRLTKEVFETPLAPSESFTTTRQRFSEKVPLIFRQTLTENGVVFGEEATKVSLSELSPGLETSFVFGRQTQRFYYHSLSQPPEIRSGRQAKGRTIFFFLPAAAGRSLGVKLGFYKVNNLGFVESLPKIWIKGFQARLFPQIESSLVGGALQKTARVGLIGKLGRFGVILSGIKTSFNLAKKGAIALGAQLAATLLVLGKSALIGALAGSLTGGIAGAIAGVKIGAALGAAIGSVIPGVGTAIGGFVGGLIGGVAGFFTGAGIGGAIGAFIGWAFPEVISGVGSFITGAFSAIGSFASSALTLLQGISMAGAATSVPVFGAIGVTVGTTVLTTILITSSFSQPEPLGGYPSPVSKYATLAKNGSFSRIEEPINYTLAVTAKEKAIVNVKISDETTFSCAGNPPSIPRKDLPLIPRVAAGETTTLTYQTPTNNQFQDCAVTNTATATFDVPEEQKTGEKTTTSFTLIIGNPPQNCPAGWPTESGYIIQGPYGYYSHRQTVGYREAIDVIPGQQLARSTIKGVVSIPPNDCLGNHVEVRSICGGKEITVTYAHLFKIMVRAGDSVNPGDIIGIIGTSGCSQGVHLHYQFSENFQMGSPYIPAPRDQIYECDQTNGIPRYCNTSWP